MDFGFSGMYKEITAGGLRRSGVDDPSALCEDFDQTAATWPALGELDPAYHAPSG